MMLKDGLCEEVRRLLDVGTDPTATSMQAIGYKEMKPYLDGLISLEEAKENLKQATRRYAKRQLTWFRRNENVNWLNIDEFTSDELVEKAEEMVKAFLGK